MDCTLCEWDVIIFATVEAIILRSWSSSFLRISFVIAVAIPVWSQTVTHTKPEKKVCVARIANSTGTPIPMDDLQQKLVEQLEGKKVNAVAVPTMTVLATQIDLTPSNRQAIVALKCDYLMLSEAEEPKAAPASSGGQPAAEFGFAIFTKEFKPVLRSALPSAGNDPAQAASAALPAVSEQVSRALSEKKR